MKTKVLAYENESFCWSRLHIFSQCLHDAVYHVVDDVHASRATNLLTRLWTRATTNNSRSAMCLYTRTVPRPRGALHAGKSGLCRSGRRRTKRMNAVKVYILETNLATWPKRMCLTAQATNREGLDLLEKIYTKRYASKCVGIPQ